ncbi:MAG TPA: hypothetical protein VHG90_03390 [Acidimicrobiales bacterium]|nr:hypothetical protein [Acidimicrobiales bacterium]
MEEHATALADAIEAALPGWVERSVARTAEGYFGQVDPHVMAAAVEAGRRARDDVGPRVRALLEADIDDQRTTPLSLLRGAVRYPTGVLRDAGVPPVERDKIQTRLFPDDVYDLAPATFADVHPSLAEVGLAWGAAKAFVHLQRHGKGGGGSTGERP